MAALALAYALYVLARNGVAPVGDLRYLADAKIDDLKTATAKAEVGAALAMLGDRIRAEKVFDVALAHRWRREPDGRDRTQRLRLAASRRRRGGDARRGRRRAESRSWSAPPSASARRGSS